ncbi:MAG: PD-(D/E)XK nuclease family protein [Muribaculaceae bacterium]
MQQRNLNSSSLSFKQDLQISFEASTHTYTASEIGQLTPVSSVVAMFFKPFDNKYWSLRKCNGDEHAAALLCEEWESKGSFASQAGTFMHKQIENYISQNIEPQTLQCTLTYCGKLLSRKTNVDISREWQHFKAFCRNVQFTPFRTEWCVFDPALRIAGTIDLVCQLPDGTFEIYDWKRSNKIDPNEQNRWAKGINGLSHLTDTSYSHYCLQQNLYRHILEQNYGLKISRMNLVVLHHMNSNYAIIPVPRMEREIDIIANHLRNRKNI